MNKKRIYVSGDRYELPYVRRIQILLESEYGYSTYINEQAEVENSLKYAANPEYLKKNLRDEIRSHSEMLLLITSQWRRNWFKSVFKFAEINNDDLFKKIETIYYLDIDECWLRSGDDLQNYLSKSLDLTFKRKTSPLWEALPEMPYELPIDPKNVWGYADKLPEREQLTWNYVRRLFTGFSEETTLESLRKTHGEILGLMNFLQPYGVTFDNSKPPDMSLGELIKDKFIYDLRWAGRDVPTYIESYKNWKFSEITLNKFHVYPPHILKGRIFISHSTQNLPLVRHLQLIAEESGYRTFVFRLGKLENTQLSNLSDVHQVSQILIALENEISECNFVLLADSKEVHLTPWTFAELIIANVYNKPVYQIDIHDLDGFDFFTRNANLQKRFNIIFSNPYKAPENINVKIKDLKYIMLAQSWIKKLTSHSDEQIADMIKSVSPEISERLSAFQTFKSIYYNRYETPETRERIVKIISMIS